MKVDGAAPVRGTPPADVAIDVDLIAALLAEQHPDLSGLPLRSVDAGWDNAIFRLGDALAVRLPRRAASAELLVNERTWLPRLAPQLSLPTPVPMRFGEPGHGYPWRWSVAPWIPGTTADRCELGAAEAESLAAFLRSLHTPAPPDAPVNPFRGVALRERVTAVEERIRRLESTTDAIGPRLLQIWQAALQAEIDVPPTWLHGDLHPRNILVDHGVITGVIDWGDLAAGDRATDLASIWMLFASRDDRAAALAAYGPISEATLQRSKGWAVAFGALLLESGLVDRPQQAAIGARTLNRVEEGP